MTTDWNPVLRGEFAKPYWEPLQAFVRAEREHHIVYPPHDEVFAALHLTPYAETKVLILGQDPYHGPRQAHGLCFSVRQGVAIPPSLVNIHKELHDDVGVPPPGHGNLEAWAVQGVLLLNTTLTVRGGQAASHQGHGWETFTDEVIRAVGGQGSPGRVHPLGQPRPAQEGADRHDPAHRHRVRAPVAAVGAQRLLRLQALLQDQRRPRRRRPRPHRLAAVIETVTAAERAARCADERPTWIVYSPGGTTHSPSIHEANARRSSVTLTRALLARRRARSRPNPARWRSGRAGSPARRLDVDLDDLAARSRRRCW